MELLNKNGVQLLDKENSIVIEFKYNSVELTSEAITSIIAFVKQSNPDKKVIFKFVSEPDTNKIYTSL